MRIEELEIKDRAPYIGLALFWKGNYIASYTSINDCITDIIFRFGLTDFESIKKKFLYSDIATV